MKSTSKNLLLFSFLIIGCRHQKLQHFFKSSSAQKLIFEKISFTIRFQIIEKDKFIYFLPENILLELINKKDVFFNYLQQFKNTFCGSSNKTWDVLTDGDDQQNRFEKNFYSSWMLQRSQTRSLVTVGMHLKGELLWVILTSANRKLL